MITPRRVWLALGCNLDPRPNMERMIAALAELGPVGVGRIVALDPVGMSGPQFLNTVVWLETGLPLEGLKRAFNAVEVALGRPRWRPDASALDRCADIDVLFEGPPPDELPEQSYIGPMLRELLVASGHKVAIHGLAPGVVLGWRGCPIGDRPRRLESVPGGGRAPALRAD